MEKENLKEIDDKYILGEMEKINQLRVSLNKDFENFIKENDDKKLKVEEEKNNIEKENSNIKLEIQKMKGDSDLSEQEINNTKKKLENESILRIQQIMNETKELMQKKEKLELELKNSNELNIKKMKLENKKKLDEMVFDKTVEVNRIKEDNLNKKIIYEQKKAEYEELKRNLNLEIQKKKIRLS